MGHSMVELSYF